MSETLRVYRRAYTPISKPVDEIVATARGLDATDAVDDCTVTEWPTTVALDDDCEAVRVYDAVDDWAETSDVDASRPFRVHTRTDPVTGIEQDVLHTPVVYLLLERDGDLAGVAPCTLADGTHVTARDFLDAIQDGDDPLNGNAADAIAA
jgi:hypothetical protein